LIKSLDRDKLQTGKQSIMLSDDELVEFFTEDMRLKKINTTVHPIPKGDPVYMLCIFQGKCGPVQALIDSGANCWLANDDIPQKELESSLLTPGPIPLGVAGGMQVNASAEWGSMLPLSDGTFQCVRGLTLERVTGPMQKLNLGPLFEQINMIIRLTIEFKT